MTASETIVAAARECIGARFRPQGRDPRFGLDCVGLAAFAYRAAGAVPEVPQGYSLRGGSAGDAVERIGRNGFSAIDPVLASPGDLLLLRPGPRQLHLAIMADSGFIHADAGLRRVVETPGRPPWPILAAWRWPGPTGN